MMVDITRMITTNERRNNQLIYERDVKEKGGVDFSVVIQMG